MKKELFDENGILYFHVENVASKGYVYSNWIGSYLTVGQVKEGSLLVLEEIKKSNATHFINDNRELEGSWDEANEWIANVWMPQALEAGLKKFAHLIPEDLYAQLSAEFMEDNSKEVTDAESAPFELKLFKSQEVAEKWLFDN